MNSKLVCVVFVIVLVSLCVGSIFPYPNFLSSNFVMANDQSTINDKYEEEEIIEEYPYEKIEVLSYDWF